MIGGYIFHLCEYDHEYSQIDLKQELYEKIKSALNGTYHDAEKDLGELSICIFYPIFGMKFKNTSSFPEQLLSLSGVPMSHSNNRWRMEPSTFFAFTTASTIGYGYTTPKTFWGRAFTFIYGMVFEYKVLQK